MEAPHVGLSKKLACAIIECVRVAEPAIGILVRHESDARGEWTKLYTRCLRILVGEFQDTKISQQETLKREEHVRALDDLDDFGLGNEVHASLGPLVMRES